LPEYTAQLPLQESTRLVTSTMADMGVCACTHPVIDDDDAHGIDSQCILDLFFEAARCHPEAAAPHDEHRPCSHRAEEAG